MSWCCNNNVSEKYMIAHCCVISTGIYFFNARSFFKITVCPGEVPNYNIAEAMDVEVCRLHCVQPQDAVQGLGTLIPLFRNGWLRILFAFCRDTGHAVFRWLQLPTLTHPCIRLLPRTWESLNSLHTAQKQSHVSEIYSQLWQHFNFAFAKDVWMCTG